MEGVGDTPPSTEAQLSFFAQPRLGEDLSLRGGLLLSSATAFVYVLVDVTGLCFSWTKYFLSFSI